MHSRNQLGDVIRGFAIVLMVSDHILAVFLDLGELRNVTRFALPLFAILSGYYAGSGPSSRYAELWLAALITWPLVVLLELALVHILLVFALVYPLLWLPRNYFLIAFAFGLLQVVNWPIPWSGYQPGYVFSFLAFGRLVREAGWILPNSSFSVPFAALVGRYPLLAYVSHITVIYLITVSGSIL
jgi:hypothetical protein